MIIINTLGACLWAVGCLAESVCISNTTETSVQLQTRCVRQGPVYSWHDAGNTERVQFLTVRHLQYNWGHFCLGVVLLLRLDVLLTLSRFCLLPGALPSPFYRSAPVPISLWFIFSSALNNTINVTLMSGAQFTALRPDCLLLWLVTWEWTQSCWGSAGELDRG